MNKNEKITIDKVLDSENLNLAIEDLAGKKDSFGIDNIRVSDFPSYWYINSENILRKFRDGTYDPNIVLERDIIGYNGKHRIVYQMTCTDRIFLRAFAQILVPVCEKYFLDFSHAYRNGYGTETAVHMAAEYVSQGDGWVAEIDILDFFDNIPIVYLEQTVEKLLQLDGILKTLLDKYLRCKIECDGEIKTKGIGILQGSPISPVLSNLYMTALDNRLQDAGYHAVRFSDNINIYTQSYEQAEEAYQRIITWLNILKLPINQKKSGVFQSTNRKFLGYILEQGKDGQVLARKERKRKNQYYKWHTSALQKVDRNYHLINDGILTKRDYTLLFENEDGKKYLPVETIDSLNIYSEVTFDSNLLNYISDKKIRIGIFNKYGENVGYFIPTGYAAGGKTLLKQVAMYLDSKRRLQVAKKMEIAAMHNIRSNIRYYKKQTGSKKLESVIFFLSNIIKEMNSCSSLDELMLLEARGRQAYYKSFNEIIVNPDFYFEQRTRRPPKDPLNAMISFGNVYLYNRLATEICKTSLDIRIGIIHSTNNRAESLNLDIAELFKPILVDRAIFTLINKKMIHIDEHFENVDNGGVYLNNAGKKIFLEELEHKIYQTVCFKGAQRTYDYILREEIQKILRMILHNETYKPYKYTT